MILFNWSYALDFLNIYTLIETGNSFYWNIFPLTIASTFLFVAGVSLSLSWNRFQKTGKPKWKKYGRRGLKILGYGILITATTQIFYPENLIFYGILHLIGTTILLSPLVISNWKKSLTAAITILTLYTHIDPNSTQSLIQAAIGIGKPGFTTFDYFPIIPFSSIIFLGLTLGHLTYPEGKRKIQLEKPEKLQKTIKTIELLGRNSLLIYLTHQPILIIILILTRHQPI